MSAAPFQLGSKASLGDLVSVARGGRKVRLGEAARLKISRSRRTVEKAVLSKEAVYGLNTGFGEQASVRISRSEIRRLQSNYVRSHACGVDEALGEEETRGILFLRANEFARGYSGVRPETAAHLAAMLNAGVLPVIPRRGSVGASGDLAPLAHMALAVVGEGSVRFKRKVIPAAKALRLAGLQPLVLEAKEALSLTNGTQAMQSVGGLALADAALVFHAAAFAAAAGLDGIMGTPAPFDERIARLKPHPGQIFAAAAMRRLLAGSQIRESHREGDERVQDPYSFRCVPQVHGAVWDGLEFSRKTVELEMSSATDNPLVYGNELLSGGNFHGQSLAFAFDQAAVVMTALGGISERRIFQVVCGKHPGLPQFLVDVPGLESGYMIAQYAAAALASENLTLSHPASVGSLPTSANKEDFVSMGMWGALKLRNVVENVSRIVAIEILAAAAAVERRRPLKGGRGVERLLYALRAKVPASKGDEPLSGKIEAVHRMILSGGFEGPG